MAAHNHDTAPCCEHVHVHQSKVESTLQQMPKEETLYDLAELFKVFGDSTSIKILYTLFERELCVCDIALTLNMSQSAISHQLRVLKQNRLVKFRKAGKEVYYSLDDSHVHDILATGLEHLSHK